MNCPSCGAPMRLKPDEDSFKCDYCESVYFPEKGDDGVRVLGEVSDQLCPVCKFPLIHAALAQVRILYCSGCRGMLVPMQVFQLLVDELRAQQAGAIVPPAADRKELLRVIDCPHCHQHMNTHFYAGPGNIIIDSCEHCLLSWLDRGELTRVVHAPDDRDPLGFYGMAPNRFE
jgi:Zn-finger nucleic acid-binding protein